MNAFAIYSANFTSACISVDEIGALLFLDQADADALKVCVERLKSEPDSVRIDFYRDMVRNRPLRGPDGILMQLIEPR